MKKEALTINVGANKTVRLLFGNGSKAREIVDLIKKGIQGPLNYFNNIERISFGVELIYSREEFDKIVGYETERWVTAHSFGNRFIIFEPSEIEKHTSHSRNEFVPIVSHETSHILLRKLNADFCTWMNEGIAQNIADQRRGEKIDPTNISYFLDECLFKNSNYKKFISRQGYEISYKLIRFLMNEYSKETIIKLFEVKYGFVKSSEKNICRILGARKSELIAKFSMVLKNSANG